MALALWLGTGVSYAAEPSIAASDWTAIQQVIAAQREALIDGDAKKAFGYATPPLRAQFGDAETFLAMVRLGFAQLLSARYTEFSEGAVFDGLVVQPMRLVGTDNIVRVALYTMERQPGGEWRISGCRIAPSTLQAASLALGDVTAGDPRYRVLESPRVAGHVE